MLAHLRYNRFWLVCVLVAAIVLTMGGLPKRAAACGASGSTADRSMGAAPLVGELPAPEACEMPSMTGPEAPCCCRSGAARVSAPKALGGHAFSQLGCGCSLQAPANPAPAELKQANLSMAPITIALPPAPSRLLQPRVPQWAFAAPTTGPPQTDIGLSTPSRAPPAGSV